MPGNLPATGKAALTAMIVSLGALLWCGTVAKHAWSRDWKPTPAVEAREYAIISDTRKPGDIRMIFWMAPPLLPNGKMRQLLEDYVIIGVVRARGSAGGTFTFDTIDTLQPTDGDAKPLRLLTGDEIPPVVNATVAMMEGMFGQSLGAFGKGIHWFVFAAGALHACKAGGLSIPFVDEVYTYRTPIPGCGLDSGPAGSASPDRSHAELLKSPSSG